MIYLTFCVNVSRICKDYTCLCRCFQDAFDCELEFKMLDEKELKSCVSCPAPWGAEFEAGPGGKGTLQRAEHGLRHLSTLSLSTTPKGGGHSAKLTPMW